METGDHGHWSGRHAFDLATSEEARLYSARRVYQSRLSAIETSDRRQSPSDRRHYSVRAGAAMRVGVLSEATRSGRSYYQPTWRHQVQGGSAVRVSAGFGLSQQ